MRLLSRPARSYALRSWDPAAGGPHVISCAGELDLHAAPALRDLLCRLIDSGKRDLVVDLTDATFIDSTVIGVLTGRLRRMRDDGGSLVLVCSNDYLMRTIAIAGMERVFDVHGSLEDAMGRGDSR